MILAPLRAMIPEVDTFGTIPAPALQKLHMDPEQPVPAVSRTALLADLPTAAVDALMDAAYPGDHHVLMVERGRPAPPR